MSGQSEWEVLARAELQCLADDIAAVRQRQANPGGQQVGTVRAAWLMSASSVREISALLKRLGVEGRVP